MDTNLLQTHIKQYVSNLKSSPEKYKKELDERAQRANYYQGWTRERMLSMSQEDIYEYVAKLWAMLIWGNKQYMVNYLLKENGLEKLRSELAELVWSSAPIPARWDRFRKKIKGIGPSMMSEILSHVHPNECIIWNRRVYVGLNYLGVKNLPRYDYQVTGERYVEISAASKVIAKELKKAGIEDASLLTVDYFIWDELQVRDNLSRIHEKKPEKKETPNAAQEKEAATFIHNEIRDKLADLGRWLGFETYVEKKVAHGSVVDTVWEATIGNMGRVIYVFEVQTKGSIDSLIVNLQKAMNNPAVQGVVAVSDAKQLEKIRKHADGVGDMSKKLKYWDYEDVLKNHESLAAVNESINKLGLVPEGF